ncbi:ciliogenesis-associated TTC17-interacting protein isoform X1 [Cynoglossus semilaevis]|uniref:ciliogenesis-associated TTC17-interacting protein isoform X1 n=1 Tax=Cynoglossus semilaevis TaxID=244447 RepID=UPI000D624B85|nr:ciliogenesis-associated TTC17-interacting protein isoform X1 [Cynoglossus semilaevis]
MAAAPKDEFVAVASGGRESPGHEEQQTGPLKASDQAVTFMTSIEPAELLKCVFRDSLVSVSESGRELGGFHVTVEFARKFQQSCVLLHAESQGTIDDNPCGTTVTTYLTTDLEVLQEDYYEYVHLKGQKMEKSCRTVQRDGQMVFDTVTTVGMNVKKETFSYPLSDLRGLVTEGSILLLMRLFVTRKKVPDHMVFISFNQGLRMVHSTFSELGLKQLDVGGNAAEVFGIRKTSHLSENSSSSWHCYFLEDGHLASRVHVGSPVTMKLLQLPSQQEKGNTHPHTVKTFFFLKNRLLQAVSHWLSVCILDFQKVPLHWEKDMLMRSEFLDRKDNIKTSHASYLRQHPEIRSLVSDFLQFLLLRKPDDVFQFARKYFLQFVCYRSTESHHNAPPLKKATPENSS